MSEGNGVLRVLPAVAESNPRQVAYGIVGRLVDSHLCDSTTLPGDVRVQLERIRDAMYSAAEGGK